MPGEDFYSALVERDDGELERIDISASAWTGPPEGCAGWWRSRVPELEKGKVYWAPPDVLLAFFEHAIAHKQNEIACVTALLLMRKRLVTWKETQATEQGSEMLLVCPRNQTDYRIPECELTPDQIGVIQAELGEKLFTDVAEPEIDTGELAE